MAGQTAFLNLRNTVLSKKPYIVGIVGGSASGKSRLINSLSRSCARFITVISLDDFYKPIQEQLKDDKGVVNFDLPQSIDREHFSNCVVELCAGQDICIDEYHFNNPEKTDVVKKPLKAKPVILVEGLFVFHFKEVREMLDLSVFVHADERIRFERRRKRDSIERGISNEMIEYQWNEHVKPAFEQYLKPYKNQVDLVINNNKSFDKALSILQHHLESKAAWQTNLQ